jgi:hypothetical protein
MNQLGIIEVIVSIAVVGVTGIQYGRREGVWAGIGMTWIALVGVSVVWSPIGRGCLDRGLIVISVLTGGVENAAYNSGASGFCVG